MKKILIFGFFGVTALFASDGGTDFVPRLVNFIIFAVILYYLIAGKIKSFLENRSNNIASEFQSIQDKLRESKEEKEALKKDVEEAHLKAEVIIKDAKEEAKLIKNKIASSTEEELKSLDKQFEDYKVSEERKMKTTVVEAYLRSAIQDVEISTEEASNIIAKKVS